METIETGEFNLQPDKHKRKGNWKGKLAAALAGIIGASVIGPSIASLIPETVQAAEAKEVQVKTWAQLRAAVEGADAGSTLNVKVMNTLAATEEVEIKNNVTVNLSSNDKNDIQTIYVNKDSNGTIAKIDNWFHVQSGSTLNAVDINFSGKAVTVTETENIVGYQQKDKYGTVEDLLDKSKVFYAKSGASTVCDTPSVGYQLYISNSGWLYTATNKGFRVNGHKGTLYSGTKGVDVKVYNTNGQQVTNSQTQPQRLPKGTYYILYTFGVSGDWYLKLDGGSYTWTQDNSKGCLWNVGENGELSQSGYIFVCNNSGDLELKTIASMTGGCVPKEATDPALYIGSSDTDKVEMYGNEPFDVFTKLSVGVYNNKPDDNGWYYVPGDEATEFTVDNYYYLVSNDKYLIATVDSNGKGNGAKWEGYGSSTADDARWGTSYKLWKYQIDGTLYNERTEQYIYNAGTFMGVAKETVEIKVGTEDDLDKPIYDTENPYVYSFSEPESVEVETNSKKEKIGYFIYSEGGSNVKLDNVTISDLKMDNDNAKYKYKNAAPIYIANGTFTMESGNIANNSVGYITSQYNDWFSGQTANRILDAVINGVGRTDSAGAIIFSGGTNHTIKDGSIIGNRSDTGAIVVKTPKDGNADSTEVTFGSDSAKTPLIGGNVGIHYAGAVYINPGDDEDSASFIMKGGEIKDNFTWYKGGAVFASCEEDGYGKGIKRTDAVAKFLMDGGIIDNNTAVHRGGAIEVMSDQVYLKKGQITNNNSRVLGGAIYVEGDRADRTYTLYLPNTYITDNHAWTETKTGQEDNDYAYLKRKLLYDAGALIKDGSYTYDNPLGNVRKANGTDILNKGNANNVYEGPDSTNEKGKKAWMENPTAVDANHRWDLADGRTSDYRDYGGYSGHGGGIWTCSLGGYASVNFLTQDNNTVGGAVVKGNYYTSQDPNGVTNNDITAHSRDGGFILTDSDTTKKGESGYMTTNKTPNYKLNWNTLYSGSDFDIVNESDVNNDPTEEGTEGILIKSNNARNGGAIAANGKIILGKANDIYEHRAEVEFEKSWAADTAVSESNKVPVAFQAYIDGQPVPGYHFVLDGTADSNTNTEMQLNVYESGYYKAKISLPYGLDGKPTFKFNAAGKEGVSTLDSLWDFGNTGNLTGDITEWNFEIKEIPVGSKTLNVSNGNYLLIKKKNATIEIDSADRDYNFKDANGNYSAPTILSDNTDIQGSIGSTESVFIKNFDANNTDLYFVKSVSVSNGSITFDDLLNGEYTLVPYTVSADGKIWECGSNKTDFTIDQTETKYATSPMAAPDKVALSYTETTTDQYGYNQIFGSASSFITHTTIAKAYNSARGSNAAGTGIGNSKRTNPEVEKYIDKKVDRKLDNITDKFTYDIIARVPDQIEDLVVSDTLVDWIVFDGDTDSVSLKVLDGNDHKGDGNGTVATGSVSGTDVVNRSLTDALMQRAEKIIYNDTLTVRVTDKNLLQNLAGKYIQITVDAKIDSTHYDDVMSKVSDADRTVTYNSTGSYTLRNIFDTENYTYRLYKVADMPSDDMKLIIWGINNSNAGAVLSDNEIKALGISDNTKVITSNRFEFDNSETYSKFSYEDGRGQISGLTAGRYVLHVMNGKINDLSDANISKNTVKPELCEVFEIIDGYEDIRWVSVAGNNQGSLPEAFKNDSPYTGDGKQQISPQVITGSTAAASDDPIHDGIGNRATYAVTYAGGRSQYLKTNTVTVEPVPETPKIEKYVNKKVDDNLAGFDSEFAYDIMAYIPTGVSEVVIDDTLVDWLQFASTENAVDAIKVLSANDHKGDGNGTVATGKVNNTGDEVVVEVALDNKYTVEKTDNTLKVTINDKDTISKLWGNWVQVTFKAKIDEADYRNVVNKLKEKDANADKRASVTYSITDSENFNWVEVDGDITSPVYLNNDDPVCDDSDAMHDGIGNRAGYTLAYKNGEHTVMKTNVVTVEPPTEQLEITKIWQGDGVIVPSGGMETEFLNALNLYRGEDLVDDDASYDHALSIISKENDEKTWTIKTSVLPVFANKKHSITEDIQSLKNSDNDDVKNFFKNYNVFYNNSYAIADYKDTYAYYVAWGTNEPTALINGEADRIVSKTANNAKAAGFFEGFTNIHEVYIEGSDIDSVLSKLVTGDYVLLCKDKDDWTVTDETLKRCKVFHYNAPDSYEAQITEQLLDDYGRSKLHDSTITIPANSDRKILSSVNQGEGNGWYEISSSSQDDGDIGDFNFVSNKWGTNTVYKNKDLWGWEKTSDVIVDLKTLPAGAYYDITWLYSVGWDNSAIRKYVVTNDLESVTYNIYKKDDSLSGETLGTTLGTEYNFTNGLAYEATDAQRKYKLYKSGVRASELNASIISDGDYLLVATNNTERIVPLSLTKKSSNGKLYDGGKIYNTKKLFKVVIKKVDDNNVDLMNARFVLKKEGESSEIALTNDGAYFKTGNVLTSGTYTLEEKMAPKGYTAVDPFTFEINDNGEVTNVSDTTGKVSIGEDNETFLITVKNYTPEKTKIKVTKKWDYTGSSYKRQKPKEITVQLLSNAENKDTFALYKEYKITGENDSDEWIYEIPDEVPKYVYTENGIKDREIEYKIQEGNVSGYSLVSVEGSQTFSYNNTDSNTKFYAYSTEYQYSSGLYADGIQTRPARGAVRHYIQTTNTDYDAERSVAFCINYGIEDPNRFNLLTYYKPVEYTKIELNSVEDLATYINTDHNKSNWSGLGYNQPTYGNEEIEDLYYRLILINQYGYAQDAAGFKDEYNLTNDQFRWMTQCAIFEYTDWYADIAGIDYTNKTENVYALDNSQVDIAGKSWVVTNCNITKKDGTTTTLHDAYREFIKVINDSGKLESVKNMKLYVYTPAKDSDKCKYQNLFGVMDLKSTSFDFTITNKQNQDFMFNKVDEDGNAINHSEDLTAQFKLVVDAGYENNEEGWETIRNAAAAYNSTIVPGDNNSYKFEGVATGTYWLVETKAPKYYAIGKPIKLIIRNEQVNSEVSNGNAGSVNVYKALSYKPNTRNVELTDAIESDTADYAKNKYQLWFVDSNEDLTIRDVNNKERKLVVGPAYNTSGIANPEYTLHCTIDNPSYIFDLDEAGEKFGNYKGDNFNIRSDDSVKGWGYANEHLYIKNKSTEDNRQVYVSDLMTPVYVFSDDSGEYTLKGVTSADDATKFILQKWNANANKWEESTSLEKNNQYRILLKESSVMSTAVQNNNTSGANVLTVTVANPSDYGEGGMIILPKTESGFVTSNIDFQFSYKNKLATYELPDTGGIGTMWFYIIGAIVAGTAVTIIVARKKHKNKINRDIA